MILRKTYAKEQNFQYRLQSLTLFLSLHPSFLSRQMKIYVCSLGRLKDVMNRINNSTTACCLVRGKERGKTLVL